MLTDQQIEVLFNNLCKVLDRECDEISGGWYLIKRLSNEDVNINLFAISNMINIESAGTTDAPCVCPLYIKYGADYPSSGICPTCGGIIKDNN